MNPPVDDGGGRRADPLLRAATSHEGLYGHRNDIVAVRRNHVVVREAVQAEPLSSFGLTTAVELEKVDERADNSALLSPEKRLTHERPVDAGQADLVVDATNRQRKPVAPPSPLSPYDRTRTMPLAGVALARLAPCHVHEYTVLFVALEQHTLDAGAYRNPSKGVEKIRAKWLCRIDDPVDEPSDERVQNLRQHLLQPRHVHPPLVIGVHISYQKKPLLSRIFHVLYLSLVKKCLYLFPTQCNNPIRLLIPHLVPRTSCCNGLIKIHIWLPQ